MPNSLKCLPILLLSVFAPIAATAAVPTTLLDDVSLADDQSAKLHDFHSQNSQTFTATLNEPAIRLLPLEPPSWDGGRLSFKMKVDPQRPNYFTAKFSGDEVNNNQMMLYLDGKQIGWRHLGEVDQLDFGTWEPAYRGRFYYDTFPLPTDLTQNKTEVQFEIRSSGLLWGYGTRFDQYQKPMTQPSRGIYHLYTHTDGCFVPPANEPQGPAPLDPPTRAAPGPEVLEQIKQRVNREINGLLNSKNPIGQMQMQLLAKAYDIKWTDASGNPRAIDQIVKGLDSIFTAFNKNPELAHSEPSTWNPDWFGLGICGQVIFLRQAQLKPYLDEKISNDIIRRSAYTQMLIDCRDWHRLNRRSYTNQTILNDTNGIYLANRGIEALDPSKALSEPDVRRYLYESVGLQPWRDSDRGGHMWNLGNDYWELTDKGLSRELGYVGTYGEIIDLVGELYQATQPAPGEEGDPKIKAQLIKIANARAAMRHPSLAPDGSRVMRLEQIIGWRDAHYPGEAAYAQRATRDASALQAAALTLDPHLIGYAQQMIDDNQFFASEIEAMNDHAQPLRTTIGRLETVDQYNLIESQPKSPYRLPMSPNQPDFVFSDEQDGVLAVKNGPDILYASLYWRARFGINNLARIHYITPRFDRIAVVRQETQFQPSGMEFTWPNWTNMAFANGGVRYPGPDLQSAYSGQKQLIAKIPDDIAFRPGQESPYGGRGDFYRLRYGPYLIGMNMTKDKTFELKVPQDVKPVMELVSKRANIAAGASLNVLPRSTVVFYLGREASSRPNG